jgi:3-methyladenine DNA glycosylase AlkD
LKDILQIAAEMEEQLEKYAQSEAAVQMSAYMKNQYEFYGIKRPVVSEVTKPFLAIIKTYSWSDKKQFIEWCWEKPQREWQYIALDLLSKNKKTKKRNNRNKHVMVRPFLIEHIKQKTREYKKENRKKSTFIPMRSRKIT